MGTDPWDQRLTVQTPHPRIVLAGDGIRCDFPVALMERAATTGFLAANQLLSNWGVAGHDLWTVPMRSRHRLSTTLHRLSLVSSGVRDACCRGSIARRRNRLSLGEHRAGRRVHAVPNLPSSTWGLFVSLSVMNDAQSADPDTGGPATQRKRRTWLAAVLTAVALLLVRALIAGALYAFSIDRAVNDNLRHSTDQLPAETPTAKGEKARPAKGSGEAINYVLMGSDSRDVGNAGHGRSDVLMVMHLAADRKSAYMISFPRDMYVPIPGHGKNKINAAFAFGGPQLTVRTLEGLLDTRMDHVALIDFEGFIQLTEELGGVRVYNKYGSVSGGYNFPVGNVTLRGEEALAYVRERKQLPHGDLDRAERQRAVLQAILGEGSCQRDRRQSVKFVNFAEAWHGM